MKITSNLFQCLKRRFSTGFCVTTLAYMATGVTCPSSPLRILFSSWFFLQEPFSQVSTFLSSAYLFFSVQPAFYQRRRTSEFFSLVCSSLQILTGRSVLPRSSFRFPCQEDI